MLLRRLTKIDVAVLLSLGAVLAGAKALVIMKIMELL